MPDEFILANTGGIDVTVLKSAPETCDERQLALEADVQRWLSRLQGSNVPDQLHDGLARYLGAGVHPGSFLTAVLESNLAVAVVRADEQCHRALGDIVAWLYTHAPARSWGNGQNVTEWRESFTQKASA